MIGTVAVVGLGKLGSPLAAVLAATGGYTVVGADRSVGLVDAINHGRAPASEPGLQELMREAGGRLSATTSVIEAAGTSDATFIVVPTPSGPDGRFSDAQVLAAIDAVGTAQRHRAEYHLVVVVSTVMPGTTGQVIRARLEASSGKCVGRDIGLCYNPEFIALGNVINGITAPDFVLIGESDTGAGDALAAIHARIAPQAPVARMNFVNAEIAKLSINTFVTTKISYANMLAEICERLPGADIEVVTGAIGKDARIGGRYLKGGLGYGGPCFPRDNVALAALARQLNPRADLPEATDAINRHQVDRLFGLVKRLTQSFKPVAILGLSYKPDTDVVEESQSVILAERLARAGHPVSVFDPHALEPALKALHGLVAPAADVAECVAGAATVVIATPWKEFGALGPEAFARADKDVNIVDCWRILARSRFAYLNLVYPGRHAGDAPSCRAAGAE
jgi:UDPglucose 6-dehydrogenase